MPKSAPSASGCGLPARRETSRVSNSRLSWAWRRGPSSTGKSTVPSQRPELKRTAVEWIARPAAAPPTGAEGEEADEDTSGFSEWLRTQREQRNLTREALAS